MAGVIALVVCGGLFFYFASRGATKCELCGNELRRESYKWKIDGKNKQLCPKCNQTLEKRRSKEATDRVVDKL